LLQAVYSIIFLRTAVFKLYSVGAANEGNVRAAGTRCNYYEPTLKLQFLKAQWLHLCTTSFNSLNLCVLTTKFICVFHKILALNGDHFPKEHQPIGFCNRNVICSL
jgi:hypothetical protein